MGGRSGERFISPAVQRERIEGWVKAHGLLLGEVFEELDESGARRDRPLLEAAVARIERGDSRGMVVARLDRVGRSLAHGLATIERITAAGGTFASVEDGLDLSTDTGRLVLRILLSMAEWELDRVRGGWAAAQQRAVARGVYIGPAPGGYRRSEDGRLQIDPVLGPLVSELFRRRAEGEPIAALVGWMNEQGTPTSRGGVLWRPSTVRSLLGNRAYLGEVRRGELLKEGAHPPLTDAATWQRAQRPAERRPLSGGAKPVLLRGLLRCAGCRRQLASWGRRGGGSSASLTYRCIAQFAGGRCPAPATITDLVIEPYIEAIFWQELERTRPRHSGGLTRARAAVERREAELRRYRDNERLVESLGAERFAEGLAVRTQRLERALLELAAARREAGAPADLDPRELQARWPSVSVAERRSLIGELIDCVFVYATRAPVDERAHVCLRGQAPVELPTPRSQIAMDLKPFDPETCGPPAVLRRRAPWSRERVRTALAPFLEGRAEWPPFSEFQTAGLALAHAQARVLNQLRAWAEEFGIAYESAARPLASWSEERIRSELSEYLSDKDEWPSYRTFQRQGRAELRRAVVRFGGVEHWAEEFGFELRRGRGSRPERWTDEAIEAALKELTAGRSTWPARRDFFAAGHARLYLALRRRGNRSEWAKRLGLRFDRRVADVRIRWTEERIARELRPLLRGRQTWPSMREFKAAGHGGLAQAIERSFGGHATWAARYGLPRLSELRAPAASPGA